MMYWLLFIFLFGVVVFIHELGHFLVAKLSGIKVERFSIGFGPVLLKKTYGETEYAISALPLGGYVKMHGEEPEEQKDEEVQNDPRSFSAKSPLVRISVAAMGPIFNLILPIFIFTGTFLMLPSVTSKIGTVVPDSPAEKAGLLPGDLVTAINGEKIWKWEQLEKIVRPRPDQEVNFQIKRGTATKELPLRLKSHKESHPFGEKTVGKAGVSFESFYPTVGISDPQSTAAKAGLKTGDVILSVNQTKIQYWWEFSEKFKTSEKPQALQVRRLTQEIDNQQSWEDQPSQEILVQLPKQFSSLQAAGIENGELFLRQIMKGSVAEEKGLKKGDKLVSVNGKILETWHNFQQQILNHKKEEPMVVGILRGQKRIEIELIPKTISNKDELTQETKKRKQLGVISAIIPRNPETSNRPYLRNPFYAIADGIQRTIEQSALVIVGLTKVFTGQLELKKSLGGPITIFYLAGDSFSRGGWALFFQMMAMLSITLGLINILPIPVLDGGHIMFYVIELLKGSPVSLRVREMAQQVGFVVLIGLILLTFYIDIHRYFDRIKALFN